MFSASRSLSLLLCVVAVWAQPTELRLGIFLSWEGGWDVGDFVSPAILRAIDDINHRDDVLPNTELKWVWHDGQCNANFATEAMMDMKLSYDVHGFVGPPCSVSVLRVAPMGNYWQLPFISWAAASPLLSDKALYPNFGRVNGNYLKFNSMFLAYAEHIGWDHLAVVYADNGLFGPTADDLVARIEDHPTISLSFTKLFSDTTTGNAGQSMLWMPLLKDSGARVVVILGYCADIRDILLAANRLDMLAGYQYMMLDATSGCHEVSGEGWPETWGPEANAEASAAFDHTLNVASLDFSSPETTAFEEGIIEDFNNGVFDAFRYPPAGTIAIDEPPTPNKYNLPYEIRTDDGYQGYALSYAALLYDAIDIYARAAHEVIQNGDDPVTQPEKVTAMLPNVNFTGFSGFVALDENLDRTPDIALQEIVSESETLLSLKTIGQFLASTQEFEDVGNGQQTYPGDVTEVPGAWVPRECTLDDFSYTQKDCNSEGDVEVVFTKKPDVECSGNTPTASSDCAYVPSNSESGHAIIALGTTGMLVSLFFMVWVVLHSDVKIVRYAQPVFCLVFLFGTLVLNMSSLLLLGENDTSTCVVSPWLFHISFTLCLAALASKIYRVWRIFDNKKLRRRRISLTDMFKVIGSFLLIDIVLLTIMAIVDPLTPEDETETADNGAPVQIEQAQCGNGGEFLFMLWAVKIALMIGASALSCQTRNVDEKFSESKFVMIALYQITVLSVIGILVASMADSDELRLLVQVFTTTVASIGSALAIFLPKVLVFYGCTEEDFVFGTNTIENFSLSKRGSVSNSKSVGSDEESVPGALEKEMVNVTGNRDNRDSEPGSSKSSADRRSTDPSTGKSSDASREEPEGSAGSHEESGSTIVANEVTGYYAYRLKEPAGPDKEVVGGGQIDKAGDWIVPQRSSP